MVVNYQKEASFQNCAKTLVNFAIMLIISVSKHFLNDYDSSDVSIAYLYIVFCFDMLQVSLVIFWKFRFCNLHGKSIFLTFSKFQHASEVNLDAVDISPSLLHFSVIYSTENCCKIGKLPAGSKFPLLFFIKDAYWINFNAVSTIFKADLNLSHSASSMKQY